MVFGWPNLRHRQTHIRRNNHCLGYVFTSTISPPGQTAKVLQEPTVQIWISLKLLEKLNPGWKRDHHRQASVGSNRMFGCQKESYMEYTKWRGETMLLLERRETTVPLHENIRGRPRKDDGSSRDGTLVTQTGWAGYLR